MNQEVPMVTQVLINVSDFARHWYLAIGITVVLLIIAFKNFVGTSEGRHLWHSFLLKFPAVGQIILQREVASFARTLGSLLQNGVTILAALDITEDVIGNEAVRRKLAELPDRVTKGEGVAAPMRRMAVFPPLVSNMLAVGEESGNLDKTLLRLADSYERKVEQQVKKLTSMIEPAIMIVIAAVVAFIVIAMLLPLVGMDPSGGLG
jgi:type II secretory pathway component PulF